MSTCGSIQCFIITIMIMSMNIVNYFQMYSARRDLNEKLGKSNYNFYTMMEEIEKMLINNFYWSILLATFWKKKLVEF